MDIPEFSLAGKVAIITGGGTGIGKSIALGFGRAGATVAVSSRRLNVVEDVAREIRSSGGHALAIKTDITSARDVESLVEQVVQKSGRIDILVNNAATDVRAPILELTEKDFNYIIDVNLKGSLLCCQAVGKRMVEQRSGSIINMSSRLAFKSKSEMGAYCISKAGVVMLTQVFASELGKFGVRTNAIAPGLVRTEFNPLWKDPEALQHYEAQVPLRRIAEPGDILGAALFLASDASSYVNGHTILIDGGFSA